MMKKFSLIFFAILFLLFSSYQEVVLGIEDSTSSTESRFALLIGNQGYKKDRLDNPHNDVDDMETALEAVGFQVRKLKEQSLWEMEQAIIGFGNLLAKNKNTVGLFYFSGHAMQYRGKNFLFPIGSMESVAVPGHLRMKTVGAEYLLETMEYAGNRLNLVFLDACRNNPFTKGLFKGRGLEKGLAPMQAPSGSLIAYATRANYPALDGKGQRNSPYARHLKQEILKPGISIFEMLTNVRAAVKKETNGSQEPDFYSRLDGEFCFKAPCGQVVPIVTPNTLSEQTIIPEVEGKWFQTHSNAGDCSQCFITITFIDSKTIRVVSNNGWTGVADYDSEFDGFNGKLKWSDNIGGVYAGIEMDMQIYKHDIWLELKARKDLRRFDATYTTIDKNTECKAWNPYPLTNETFTWSGQCINAVAQGKGTLQWYEDGVKEVKYVGEVKDGKYHGYGKKSYADGTIYEGNWKNGKLNGKGKYTCANGCLYEGEFVDDQMNGQGIKIWPNGGRYEGEWRNNKMNGQGIITWPTPDPLY